MTIATLAPDAILSSTNLTGAVTDIDERILINFGADNTGRYYTIPHDSALDGVSAGWAWGVWTNIVDNTGSTFQYLLSTALSGIGRINLWMPEASSSGGGTPNRWTFVITDDGGVSTITTSANTTSADGLLRLIVLQYTGTAVQLYSCRPGVAAVQLNTTTVALGNITYLNNIHFGARQDLAAGRFDDSHAGHLFKANRSLTTGEIASIAAGASPISILAADCAGYWEFTSALTTVSDEVGSSDATRVGTWP